MQGPLTQECGSLQWGYILTAKNPSLTIVSGVVSPAPVIGPISGIVLFEVVYINKWSTPQEAASWLHEPASMYEVIPSKPISTEEFTAKQLQWECMKAIQAVR